LKVVTTGGGNEREYGMKLEAFCMRSGSRRQGGPTYSKREFCPRLLSREIGFFATFLDRLEKKLDVITGYPNLAWLRWDDERFQ